MTKIPAETFGAHVVDGREMVAPEPLEATMDALDRLPAGEELVLLLYVQPHPLYRILQQNGYAWSEAWAADGTNVIRIRAA